MLKTILSDGLLTYLYNNYLLERLPRACSGPRTPNDSLVKRRITLSSSQLAKLEGREKISCNLIIIFNLFSETNSGYFPIFTWPVFQISVKTLFCYIAKPEYWIYVMSISRIRDIEFMLCQYHGSVILNLCYDNITDPWKSHEFAT